MDLPPGLTAGDCNPIGRMRWQNQYQHLVLTEVDDTSRIVASLDRKRLGMTLRVGGGGRSEAFSIRPHAPLAHHQA